MALKKDKGQTMDSFTQAEAHSQEKQRRSNPPAFALSVADPSWQAARELNWAVVFHPRDFQDRFHD